MKPTQGKSIIFLGDSITEGLGASETEKRYADLVVKDGEFANGYNYGISGTRIARQQHPTGEPRWNESFLERADRMVDYADYVLVFGGTNDYGHGDAAFGALGDDTPDTFYGGMDCLLKKLVEKYPTSNIIVMTPLHRAMENRAYNEFGLRNCATLSQYVQAEREVAEKYGIPVLDLYATSGICPDDEVNRNTYAPDGLHPNDRGHRLIADKILRFIANNF